MADLVVFGATGFAGSKICDEALRRGHRVTAVSRHGGDITGSLYDAALVDELTGRADILVCAITSGPDDEGHTLPDALPIMVDAARRHGVRIAVVGGAGSLLLTEDGPEVIIRLAAIAPPDKLRDIGLHGQFLDAIRRTPDDVNWFYLSPPTGFGAHVPGQRLGHYRAGGDVLLTDDAGYSAISGEDYATAFVDEIETPRHQRRRFTVAY